VALSARRPKRRDFLPAPPIAESRLRRFLREFALLPERRQRHSFIWPTSPAAISADIVAFPPAKSVVFARYFI
jgi:hypothetical protein